MRAFSSLKRLFIQKKDNFIEYTVTKSSIFKQFIVLELKEVQDMDTALNLKDTILYALREDFQLDENEFFLADLIGIDVIDAENGTVYGKVKDIINRGASDIYVIDTPNGEKMIPAVKEFIVSIDINKGVFVHVIDGLLD